MEKNQNSGKTIVDEGGSGRLKSKNQTEKLKERKLKFKNLTIGQKRLLESSAAGLSGIAVGAVAMVLMGASGSAEPEDPNTADNKLQPPVEVPIFTEAPFSEVVTDDMSFNEAFAAARKDVGAGGFFEWKGATYNTYYKEEWDSLSPEKQQEFMASVDPGSGGEVVSEDIIIQILNGDKEDPDIDVLDHEDIVIIDDDASNSIDLNDVVVIDDDFDTFDQLDDIVIINDNDPFSDIHHHPDEDVSDLEGGDDIDFG